MKIPVDLLAKSEAEFSKSAEDINAIRRRIRTESAVTLDGPERAEKRRAMIAATAREDVVDAFERYIGTNDLLPINYLAIGYLKGRPVGRVRYFDRTAAKVAMA